MLKHYLLGNDFSKLMIYYIYPCFKFQKAIDVVWKSIVGELQSPHNSLPGNINKDWILSIERKHLQWFLLSVYMNVYKLFHGVLSEKYSISQNKLPNL